MEIERTRANTYACTHANAHPQTHAHTQSTCVIYSWLFNVWLLCGRLCRNSRRQCFHLGYTRFPFSLNTKKMEEKTHKHPNTTRQKRETLWLSVRVPLKKKKGKSSWVTALWLNRRKELKFECTEETSHHQRGRVCFTAQNQSDQQTGQPRQSARI